MPERGTTANLNRKREKEKESVDFIRALICDSMRSIFNSNPLKNALIKEKKTKEKFAVQSPVAVDDLFLILDYCRRQRNVCFL